MHRCRKVLNDDEIVEIRLRKHIHSLIIRFGHRAPHMTNDHVSRGTLELCRDYIMFHESNQVSKVLLASCLFVFWRSRNVPVLLGEFVDELDLPSAKPMTRFIHEIEEHSGIIVSKLEPTNFLSRMCGELGFTATYSKSVQSIANLVIRLFKEFGEFEGKKTSSIAAASLCFAVFATKRFRDAPKDIEGRSLSEVAEWVSSSLVLPVVCSTITKRIFDASKLISRKLSRGKPVSLQLQALWLCQNAKLKYIGN